MTTDSDALVHEGGGRMERLLEIMARLRDPETGCPWDIEQNWQTIIPYTIEEAHEVADAIEREAWPEVKAELGDLLLQVVYYAQMAREEGRFDFDAIVKGIADKMVARHPHVFGDESRDKSADDQVRDWEKIKAAERAAEGRGERTGALDGVALGLPALTRALKLQKRAARVGFDWTEVGDVLDKVSEECAELAEAKDRESADRIEEEFGDLMFVMVNLGRHLEVDPEQALRRANGKFTRRFEAIEAALAARGKTPQESSLEEMDALWDAAKAAEKARAKAG
ncbi:nucleoside triphosphate pyrophosphohydrolase [Halovulum sp. GXIMD14794]